MTRFQHWGHHPHPRTGWNPRPERPHPWEPSLAVVEVKFFFGKPMADPKAKPRWILSPGWGKHKIWWCLSGWSARLFQADVPGKKRQKGHEQCSKPCVSYTGYLIEGCSMIFQLGYIPSILGFIMVHVKRMFAYHPGTHYVTAGPGPETSPLATSKGQVTWSAMMDIISSIKIVLV